MCKLPFCWLGLRPVRQAEGGTEREERRFASVRGTIKGVNSRREGHMRCLVCMLLLSKICRAQKADFATDVKLVGLVVTVRDHDGKAVTNLTKDDFLLE